MRNLLLGIGLLPLCAFAQPGPDVLFLDPCASASYGVPLQNIARNDVQVSTYGVGTDDVPSSSGNCLRNVSVYEHAAFLYEFDPRTGNWSIVSPKSGDVLHPDSLQAGIAARRLRWGPGSLQVCYMGYGGQHDGKGWHLMEPRTWERSIVRLTTPEAVYLVAMTVSYLEPEGIIDVRGRRVVLEGEPLPIH
jgi:hypothetical protein